MADIKIIDLGWLSKDRTGTQATNMVNSGTAIIVDNGKVSLKRAISNDSANTPGSLSYYNTNVGSAGATKYNVELSLHNNTAADQLKLKHLSGIDNSSTYFGIDRTAGVKAIFISDVTQSYKSLVELLGDSNTSFHESSEGAADAEIGFELPALLVYVQKVTVTADPGDSRNKILVILECIQA